MKAIKSFIITSLIGGLIVLLPIGLLLFVIKWIHDLIMTMIEPLTRVVVDKWEVGQYFANIIVLLIIVAACFFVGLAMRTWIGMMLHGQLEQRILKIAPGYTLIKETIKQLLGNRASPFQSVALCNISDSQSRVTGFITEKHENGNFTVFVPTAPSPLSGNVYHLTPNCVSHVEISVEEAMQTMISCGAGSNKLSRNQVENKPSEVS